MVFQFYKQDAGADVLGEVVDKDGDEATEPRAERNATEALNVERSAPPGCLEQMRINYGLCKTIATEFQESCF